MKKLQLDIPLLLPEIPDEKDACVERLISTLEEKEGIEKAHVKDGKPAELCIHYDPGRIPLEKVKAIARQSGAELTGRFRHLPLAGGWTQSRDLPAPSGTTFMAAWAKQAGRPSEPK